MALSATERSRHARIAALTRSANEPSGTAMTARARESFRDSFLTRHECDLCGLVEIPEGTPDAERQRRADAAYTAHMTRLSQRAAVARRRAAGHLAEADQAEAELQQLDGVA
jgi:hypothetical protein